MRISDWSSDVCSSDLYVPATRWKTTDDPFGRLQFLHCRSAMLRAGIVGGMLFDFILLGGGRCAIVRAREVDGDVLRNTEAKRDRDRKSVVAGKSVSVRVDLGGRRIIKKKNTNT